MYANVLVATDGGEEMDDVVDHALAVAGDHGATVHALYVVNKRLYLASEKDDQERLVAELQREGEAAVAAVAERVRAAGLEAVTAVSEGVPGPEILDYVEEHGVDLVVMGTHDPTDRDRPATLGSVAERVTNDATVPVLTVRLGE